MRWDWEKKQKRTRDKPIIKSPAATPQKLKIMAEDYINLCRENDKPPSLSDFEKKAGRLRNYEKRRQNRKRWKEAGYFARECIDAYKVEWCFFHPCDKRALRILSTVKRY